MPPLPEGTTPAEGTTKPDADKEPEGDDQPTEATEPAPERAVDQPKKPEIRKEAPPEGPATPGE